MGRSQNDKDSGAHHHENKLTTKIGAGMEGETCHSHWPFNQFNSKMIKAGSTNHISTATK
jgi:hypothetical protein